MLSHNMVNLLIKLGVYAAHTEQELQWISWWKTHKIKGEITITRALALWCQSIFACLSSLTLKPYSSSPSLSPSSNLTAPPSSPSLPLFPPSISHLAPKLSVRAVGDTPSCPGSLVLPQAGEVRRVCARVHVRTLQMKQKHTSPLSFSFDVPGGGRICEGGDRTKCHFGGAVDGRPEGEVRCAKEQEWALFSVFFFFFGRQKAERQVNEAPQWSLSSENNGNLQCVFLHVDVFECLLMLESSVSHV